MRVPGLVYHWRARRHAETLWQSYREALAASLANWRTLQDTLILVGPSGGYTLTEEFLSRFSRIICVDPDPLAPVIFRRRFPALRVRCEWREQECFSAEDNGWSLHRFEALLSDEPKAAVFFANCLGQLCPQQEAGFARFLWQLEKSLQGRVWASAHDLCSGGAKPLLDGAVDIEKGEVWEAAAKRSYSIHSQALLTDHGMEGFVGEMPRRYLAWELTPGYHHLVEFVAASDPFFERKATFTKPKGPSAEQTPG